MDNLDEVLQALIDDNLDLLRLRQVAYLFARDPMNNSKHEYVFMQKYRANRNSQFESIQYSKPTPLEKINTLEDARNYAARQWDTKFRSEIGSEFWRDEWTRWEGSNIRKYAKSQGKKLARSIGINGEFIPSLMPTRIPKGYGNPDDVYGNEETLRAWRRLYTKSGEEKRGTHLSAAFRKRWQGASKPSLSSTNRSSGSGEMNIEDGQRTRMVRIFFDHTCLYTYVCTYIFISAPSIIIHIRTERSTYANHCTAFAANCCGTQSELRSAVIRQC
jgi:hypothetical protein